MGASDVFSDSYLLDFYDNLQIELSDTYINNSTVLAIIVGILCAGLIIATAFLNKKGRAYAIIAGIMQIAGVYAMQKMAHTFMELELFRVVTGTSENDVYNKVNDFYMESLIEMIPYVLLSWVVLAAWVLTLVFIIKSMKLKPKILPVFGLITHIVRYVFILPFPLIQAFFEPVTEQMQKNTDILNYIFTLIPFVLVFIAGLLTFLKSKKTNA